MCYSGDTMAKKRAAKKRNPLGDEADQAAFDLAQAHMHYLFYDPSAEMRKRVNRAAEILDMRWNAYQDSLMPPKKGKNKKGK